MRERCAVLDWAASGAMALTGMPSGRPVASPAPALARLGQVTAEFAQVTTRAGKPVRADPAALITGRGALAGFTRAGQVSAGGSSFLLRSADGWCAVTLSRAEDVAAVPAIAGSLGLDGANLDGIATPAGPGLTGAVVADLSSMWAGPLCARLLGLAGAEVIKVESPTRPDGARSGNGEFFDWLHPGHRSLSADFSTREGRTVLRALLEVADIVVESSRPRALAALGLAPETTAHRPGQVWLSITGSGRAVPGRVAFGDDAAVAGGLVGWAPGEPSP